MIGENKKKHDHGDVSDESLSGETADHLPDISHFDVAANPRKLDRKVDEAIKASAAREAQARGLVETQTTETGGANKDESTAVESQTGQEVLGPSDSHYNADAALPMQYDGRQLVGVTVSSVGAEIPDTVGLVDLGVILKRDFRTIALIVFLISALTALALALVTPRFSATTSILFGPSVTADRGTASILTGVRDDDASMQSQVALLMSNDLALRVIDEMGLEKNPEFVANPETSRQAVDNGLSAAKMETLEIFSKRLGIERVPGTRVVTLSFSAADSAVASGTVNTLAELYIQDQRDSKFGAINDAAKWLTSQVSELRRQVSASELDIEKFRLDTGIFERNGMTLNDQELTSLNGQLIESRAEAMEAQTRLREIRGLLATPDGIDSAAEVLDSSLIQRLREQESILLADMAELGSELGNKHPRLLQTQAEASQVRKRIDQETAKIVNALEYQYNVARSREQAIASSLASASGQLEASADAIVQLNVMEREVAADRLLLETMLGKLKQVGSLVDMSSQEPDARIISRALTPIKPSFPKTGILLALSIFGSTLLAVMFVLIREFADRTIRSEHQVADKLNLIPFGIIPRTSRRQRKGLTPFQYAAEKPRSRYAEAARALAQKIQTVGFRGGGRTIMTTASRHGEGKSDVAIALANALSLQGCTVLLIDTDHFSPQLHEKINIQAGPGWIEVLERRVSIKDAIYVAKTNRPFALMPIGDRNLLFDGGPNHAALEGTLTILKEYFDYVIIDAPAVLISNDALVLGRMVDASVLVMRWGKTHRRTAKTCAEKLAQAGCQTVGGVLTDVNLGKYELYEYGQSGSCTKVADGCYEN